MLDSALCVLVASCALIEAQYVPPSPCPDQFSYESNGLQTYGMIRYQPPGRMSSVTIKANFSVKAVLPSSYIGSLEILGQKQGVLQSMLRGEMLYYRVNFPVTSPLPKLNAISVNGEIKCFGEQDYAGPGEVLTSISLNHMLYADGESSGQIFFNQPTQSKPTFTGNVPNRNPTIIVDGHQYELNSNNFNIDDSNEHSFTINTITIPNRVSNNNNNNNNHHQYVPQIYPSSSGNNENRPTIQFQPSPQLPEQQQQQQPGQVMQSQPIAPLPIRPQPTQPQTIPTQQFPPQPVQSQPMPPQPIQPQPIPSPPIQPQPTQPQQIQPQPTLPQQIEPQSTSPQPKPPQVSPMQPVTVSPTECGTVSGGNERVALVYQGSAVARGDWPWLTAIYVKRGNAVHYICTGSLVSNRHVITAAHCMHEKSSILSMSRFVIKTGAFNLDSWSDAVIRGLSDANIHPSYNAVTLENDILLLTLDSTVEFTSFNSPVCLWEGATDASFVAGQYGSVVGWGLNEIRGSGQGEPRMASIPVVTTDTCRASRIEFHKLTSKNTICAGDRNGTGPCNGDSGGGLYMLWGGRWRLRGVVSVALRPVTGEAKCNLNEYVVFTDVAQYLPWLQQHMAA